VIIAYIIVEKCIGALSVMLHAITYVFDKNKVGKLVGI